MGKLDKIDANASKFNLIQVAKNRFEIYMGPNFVPFDIDHNVANAVDSWARWPIAF